MTRFKWSAKRTILICLALALSLAGHFFYTSDQDHLVEGTLKIQKVAQGNSANAVSGLQASPRDLVEVLHEEAQRVGKIDESPAESKKRLEALAASLTKAEVKWLSTRALDTNIDADERFLAAYLIAERRSNDAFMALKQIAAAPTDNKLSERMKDMEFQVRAQAIEGLGKLRNDVRAEKALKDVAMHSQEAFLRDRAQRSLYEWRTGKTVEEQDEEAMEKLLRNAS